ncbi:hypothetical protein Q1695_012315 [Nippostrongylus brasiliensis]|nr:hypothetical protein Q1695_012315 [Nippostrongylus brasiliensis]
MSDDAACAEHEQVFSALILRYALLFNVACSVAAIPLLLLVIKATYQHKLVHYNIKWILIFHFSCLVVHDAFRLVNHIWDLTLFITTSPGECNLYRTERCLFLRIPINLTMYIAFSGTFMLSIERCIATWKLQTYGKNRVVGPVIVFVQILLGLTFMFVVYYELEHQARMPYCLITSLSPPTLVIGSISVLVLLQVIAVVIFEVLVRINQVSKQHLLHSRTANVSDGVISRLYQVRENVRTMETLMLFFLVSCLNGFFYNLLRGFVHLNKTKFSRPLFYALIEVSIHLPQSSLIVPAVLWYSYRKVSRKAAAEHQEKLDRAAHENTNLHFNIIAESWR